MDGVRLSDLPDQTARDISRDAANAQQIELLATAGGLELSSRVQSDMHIKWLARRGSVIPAPVAKRCEVKDEAEVIVIMLPRSYENYWVRWVDTVPYVVALLCVASAAIWTGFAYRVLDLSVDDIRAIFTGELT